MGFGKVGVNPKRSLKMCYGLIKRALSGEGVSQVEMDNVGVTAPRFEFQRAAEMFDRPF